MHLNNPLALKLVRPLQKNALVVVFGCLMDNDPACTVARHKLQRRVEKQMVPTASKYDFCRPAHKRQQEVHIRHGNVVCEVRPLILTKENTKKISTVYSRF